MQVLFILIFSILVILSAPYLSARVMGIQSSVGKAALLAFPLLGVTNIIGMISSHLGPLGGLLGSMLSIAAWFQLIRIVYKIDHARTFIFMFWHIFFTFLFISLVQLVVSISFFELYGL